MQIGCVGAGPGGLYFAIAAKLADAGNEITVIERDPPGATYGWGVIFGDDLLDMWYAVDEESGQEIRAATTLWRGHELSRNGTDFAWSGSWGYSVNRATLLDILDARAREVGVTLHYEERVDDLAAFGDADVVVVADGAGSGLRTADAEHFGTRVEVGRNRYIWLGTTMVFPHFTIAFQETPAGWVWFHGYPSSEAISTCIIECSPETWTGLGLDEASVEDGLRELEGIFARQLAGASLISDSRGQPGRWLRFPHVTNTTWLKDRAVLLGDAAHTTHFTLGSGTRLAMVDAVNLAETLRRYGDVEEALEKYDRQRRQDLHRIQARARSSMAWFEQAGRYAAERDAVELAYAMSGRGHHYRPWRYEKFRAKQHPVVRRAGRMVDDTRRWYYARRRGERPHAGMLTRRPGEPAREPVAQAHDGQRASSSR